VNRENALKLLSMIYKKAKRRHYLRQIGISEKRIKEIHKWQIKKLKEEAERLKGGEI